MERIFRDSVVSAENAIEDAFYKKKNLDERISGLDQMINDDKAECREVKSYFDAMYGTQWPTIIRERVNARIREHWPLLEKRKVLTDLRFELCSSREKVIDQVTFCERVKGVVSDDELKSCIDKLRQAIAELNTRGICA